MTTAGATTARGPGATITVRQWAAAAGRSAAKPGLPGQTGRGEVRSVGQLPSRHV
jgi:hypothetical protein